MLPLAHRVLLTVSKRPSTARELSRELAADYAAMHRVLRGLQIEGAVERSKLLGNAALWRLAPGVKVELRPATVVVTGAKPGLTEEARPGQCRMIGSWGWPCRLPAAFDGLCFVHMPREPGFVN